MWTFEWGAKIPKCATVYYPGKPVEIAHVVLYFITLKEKKTFWRIAVTRAPIFKHAVMVNEIHTYSPLSAKVLNFPSKVSQICFMHVKILNRNGWVVFKKLKKVNCERTMDEDRGWPIVTAHLSTCNQGDLKWT